MMLQFECSDFIADGSVEAEVITRAGDGWSRQRQGDAAGSPRASSPRASFDVLYCPSPSTPIMLPLGTYNALGAQGGFGSVPRGLRGPHHSTTGPVGASAAWLSPAYAITLAGHARPRPDYASARRAFSFLIDSLLTGPAVAVDGRPHSARRAPACIKDSKSISLLAVSLLERSAGRGGVVARVGARG